MAAGSLARPHAPPQVPLSRRPWLRVAPVTPHPAAGVALAFPGPGPQAQRPQPWSFGFDPRLSLPSLSKLWAASGCRSKLLMKRPVAAECGRLSPEWRHGRSCCRATKGVEQQEFLSCGPSGTSWGAGWLCSGITDDAVQERIGAQGSSLAMFSFCYHG